MEPLNKKNCIPCQGGVPPLPLEQKLDLLRQLHGDWQLSHNQTRLRRTYKFSNYADPYELVKSISDLAEKQWHHPEIQFGWGHLEIEIWTHKIGDLVESDFILAAKVDQLESANSRA